VFDNTSNYESSFTINITRDFKNIGAKQSTFEFYFPENYFGPNSEFNIQPYSTNITFNPEPEEKYFEYDSFQNKILKFSYNNIYGFSVSLKFTGTLKSKNNNIVFIPFPYSEKEIKTADYIYLDSTSTSSILELAWQVSKNKSNLLSILFQIKQFIDTNIKYTPIYQNRTIDEIISDKISNKKKI